MYRVQPKGDDETNYKLMAYMARRVLEDEDDMTACLANISAVINGYMRDINWAGFYLAKGGQLVLGPFQGLPACVRIAFGKGVCGSAAEAQAVRIVDDVGKFPGHIACDGATKSEIVLPIVANGEVYGVLDVDSPVLSRFGRLEERYLSEIAALLKSKIESKPESGPEPK